MKSNNQNNSSNILQFMISIVAISLLYISMIYVGNECKSTQVDIELLQKEKRVKQENVKQLENNIKNLSLPGRIKNEAKTRLGMISPQPESLIVYLNTEDFS